MVQLGGYCDAAVVQLWCSCGAAGRVLYGAAVAQLWFTGNAAALQLCSAAVVELCVIQVLFSGLMQFLWSYEFGATIML